MAQPKEQPPYQKRVLVKLSSNMWFIGYRSRTDSTGEVYQVETGAGSAPREERNPIEWQELPK